VMGFTLLAALVLLSPLEAAKCARAAFAATLSVSNLLFWHSANYFQTKSDLIPLLMTWSLGVEEQFYAVIPLLMALVARIRRNWTLPAILAVCALSFLLAQYQLDGHSQRAFQAAFYLLPARAWELGVGVALAVAEQRGQRNPIHALFSLAISLAGLILILAPLVLLDAHSLFPGVAALPSVLGTAMLIAVPGSWTNRRVLSLPPLAFVGRVSYSWYLWHWPLLGATFVGAIAVSIIAYLFGLGVLRLRGAYFALATIGVNEAVSVFVTNFEPWGGATGLYLSLDAYAPLGGPGRALWIVYFLMVAVMGLSLALSYGIRHSKFGLGLMAIGENEDAAATLGVPTRIYKAMVYSVSAFLPAIAGGLYFFKSGIIEPTGAFDLTTSIEAIVMVMLGGQGTVAGPAIGAFLYEELRGYLLTAQAFSHFQLVIAGLLLLVIVLFAPGGLMGFVHQKLPFTRRWLE